MLHTYLTTSWGLHYPIIGAPMAYVGRGRLARAVTQAGGLGMLGIGSSESVEFLMQEVAIARGSDSGRFGIGMHSWAIEKRPDLLDAAIEARPFLISISFGSPAPYVERLHQHGILLATQVNTRAEAIQAETAAEFRALFPPDRQCQSADRHSTTGLHGAAALPANCRNGVSVSRQ